MGFRLGPDFNSNLTIGIPTLKSRKSRNFNSNLTIGIPEISINPEIPIVKFDSCENLDISEISILIRETYGRPDFNSNLTIEISIVENLEISIPEISILIIPKISIPKSQGVNIDNPENLNPEIPGVGFLLGSGFQLEFNYWDS